MAKQQTWYVADFETTGLNYYREYGCTKVWLWSICDSNANVIKIGSTIDEFFEYIRQLYGSIIYFHNLRFDGSFILNYLLTHDYQYKDKLLANDNKGFSTLIGSEGQYYQIKFNYCRKRQITICDSLKIMPIKVSQLCREFNLPIEKGIIDYQDYTIDEHTKEYVSIDVRAVAMGLKYFKDLGYNKMTIGSNAYKDYIDTIDCAKDLFPRLPDDFLIEWRKSYRGGRTQVNPIHKNKVLHNIYRYDYNSMYPSIMAFKPLPYGQPISIKTRGQYKFELYQVTIQFTLKQGHIPTLLKAGSMFDRGDETYYITSEGIINLWITSIDYELLEKHYDIQLVQFNKMFGFKTSTNMFRKWILEKYHLKSTTTGGIKMVHKYVINNLYGKFGSKLFGRRKIPKLEDDILSYELSSEDELRAYYLPIALAITSWGHYMIDEKIEEVGYENFVYCDTDSVHTLVPITKDVDNKELGKMKLEGIEEVSKYVRQKCYIYKQDNEWTITCSGMVQKNKEYLTRVYGDECINHFKVGLTIDKNSPDIRDDELKLRPVQVKGGVLLVPTRFSMI